VVGKPEFLRLAGKQEAVSQHNFLECCKLLDEDEGPTLRPEGWATVGHRRPSEWGGVLTTEEGSHCCEVDLQA